MNAECYSNISSALCLQGLSFLVRLAKAVSCFSEHKERLANLLWDIQSFLGSTFFRVFREGSSLGSFSRVWFEGFL